MGMARHRSTKLQDVPDTRSREIVVIGGGLAYIYDGYTKTISGPVYLDSGDWVEVRNDHYATVVTVRFVEKAPASKRKLDQAAKRGATKPNRNKRARGKKKYPPVSPRGFDEFPG